MSDETEQLRQKVAALEQEVATLKRTSCRGVRKRSEKYIWGLPLYDIACGPDPTKGEARGHARGFIAIGDIATGVIAMGGVARGFMALGGVALGGITLGGCSIGILCGIGGLATGALAIGGLAIGVLALGGGAIGVVAIGGGAFGYYACGGDAIGKYVIDASQRDPEAVRFFNHWMPGISEKLWGG
ncbi:MAG: hypothetical protein WD738_09730 [Pirellulales bacterium]